ncbi:MAG: hypothetical protein AABX49_00750 [Nanoarchaeota archaeon]
MPQVKKIEKPAAEKISENKPSVQQHLIDSNLKLQQKLVELIESNKEVSKNLASTSKEIQSMTDFFKEAGKYMVAETEDEKLKPLLNRISDLVEQNKMIMRSLILIQKYIKASPPVHKDIFSE